MQLLHTYPMDPITGTHRYYADGKPISRSRYDELKADASKLFAFQTLSDHGRGRWRQYVMVRGS